MSIKVESELASVVTVSGHDVGRLAKVCSLASIPRNMDGGGECGPEYQGAVDFAMTLGMAIQERKRYPEDPDFVTTTSASDRSGGSSLYEQSLLIEQAVLAEREACAKLVEGYLRKLTYIPVPLKCHSGNYGAAVQELIVDISKMIRERN